LAIVTTVVLCGCASYQTARTYDFTKTRTIAVRYDLAWRKAVEWFAAHNAPIEHLNKSSGLISTEYNLGSVNTTICDCGDAMSGLDTWYVDYPVGYFNMLLISMDSTHTQVTINSSYKTRVGLRKNQGSGEVDCYSTGELEKDIFASMQE
jgi:hypothetical protein